MDMIPGYMLNFYIWTQELPVVKLASHFDVIVGSAGNIYALFVTKIWPRMFGETDVGLPVLMNVQTWSLGNRGV
jgi:hypothetical protein